MSREVQQGGTRFDMSSTAVADPTSDERIDARLVERARLGDVAAFEALVDRHLDRGYRIASALIGVPEADVVVADTFLAAWRQLPRLTESSEFAAWFDSILVGDCRMRARPPAVATAARRLTGGHLADDAADGLEHEQALRLLDEAFEQLDVVDRIVLVLHEVAGQSPADIARTVHEPVGAVRVRIAEAAAALLRALEPRP